MVRELIRRKFPSNARAARRLHELWVRAERAAARRVTVGSLATKIGDLERGKIEWWDRRLSLTQLFADLLDCTVLDLLGRPAVPAGSLHFPEFPAMPPLRPDEEVPRLRRGGWLLERVRDADHAGVRVIVAGPGMGKSFVVRWLQARAAPEFAAISTTTLAGVGALVHDPRILVIDVDERDPRTDAEALRALKQRPQPTIVLAPFELAGVAKDESLLVFDARARASLLAWIADRLDRSERDTHLDLEEVRAWLNAHDPEFRLVATPADLLAFCADVDAAGLAEGSWEVRARRWLRATVRLFAPDARSSAPPVEGIVDALCRATVTRRENPWGALPGDLWPTLVPDDLCGPDASRWGRALIVHALRAVGLLRGAANGLTLTPSWVHHGLAAAQLDRMLAGEDIDAWGLLAADESRQQLVDEALERRTNTGLRATVRAVVREPERRTLGLLAAREAVFTAAARRLLHAGFEVPLADLPAWHRLAEHQIASLKHDPRICYPLTRREWEGSEAFWADGWTFSMYVPPPARFEHPGLAWHFPGWVAELPPVTDDEHWPTSAIDPWRASESVQRIARLAPAILVRLSALPDGHSCPRVLLPAIVLLAPQRGWTLTPQLLYGLSGSWEGHFLAELLPRRPAAERTAIADMLWDALPFMPSADAQAPVAVRLQRIRNSAGEFLPFIAANLGDATLVRTIDTDGIYRHESQVEPLRQLPRPLRRIIVRKVLAAGPGRLPAWHTVRPIIQLLDIEDVDLVLEVIRDSDKTVAAEFTGFVWNLAPALAQAQAYAAIRAQRPAAHAWCWLAPKDHLGVLAEALQTGPRPLPDWVAEWATFRLLGAGAAAESLFALSGR